MCIMNILWIVNNVFPELAKQVGLPMSASGTWLEEISQKLAATNSIELAIAADSGDKFQEMKAEKKHCNFCRVTFLFNL